MPAGLYRHRISVERAPLENVTGIPVRDDWDRYATRIPADVRPANMSRMEAQFEAQLIAVATHTVRVRHDPQIRLRDRVIWHDEDRGDRVLWIQGLVDPDNRRRELVLACVEQMAENPAVA